MDNGALISYGFTYSDGVYTRDFPIMQGQFCLKIFIAKDGSVDYRVFDAQTNEEYFLARVSGATGNFIGEIHSACEKILLDVARNCFHTEHFRNEQTRRVLHYIKITYGVEPEFLWKNFPDYAALRLFGNKKWFAFVGKVEKSKFGLPEGGIAEILNLKNDPAIVAARIEEHRAYKAYHMNKQCWFSTILEDDLQDDELFSLIDQSFILVNS